MLELPIQRAVWKRASELGSRLFRQNVGQGWVGEVSRMRDGSMLIRNPRPLHAGLVKGSSDLIGWTPVTITPEMIGKRVAVFTAIECKRPKGGRISAQQRAFADAVLAAGGIAGFPRSAEEVEVLLGGVPGPAPLI